MKVLTLLKNSFRSRTPLRPESGPPRPSAAEREAHCLEIIAQVTEERDLLFNGALMRLILERYKCGLGAAKSVFDCFQDYMAEARRTPFKVSYDGNLLFDRQILRELDRWAEEAGLSRRKRNE